MYVFVKEKLDYAKSNYITICCKWSFFVCFFYRKILNDTKRSSQQASLVTANYCC